MTPQYKDWFKSSATQESRDESSKEIKRLMAIIEAKDRENVQLRESVEVNKAIAENHRGVCQEMRQRHQELKRKCGELYDEVKRMKDPHHRESKNVIIDRFRKCNDLMQERLKEMM